LRSSEGAALGAAIQALGTTASGEEIAALAPRLAPVDEVTRVEPRGDFDYAAKLLEQNRLRRALFNS
jgi:hypothetical protein